MFNMFIMKKQLFEEYSKWLFEVLAVYQEIMTDTTGKVHERSCGFAGEHLLNIWGHYMIKYQNIKAVELQTVFINCTDINYKMTDRERTKLVLATNGKWGVIFVHDCRNQSYIGCRKAVEEFALVNHVGFIVLPDGECSAVMMKT